MKVLLDQGLPRSAAELLTAGIDALHTGECGLAQARCHILDYARQQDRVVVTLDADFHTRAGPGHGCTSVIRIRIEGL